MDSFKAFRVFNDENRIAGRIVDTTLDELSPGEVVFKTRALRAFENAATRYPIHRFLRCAVPRPMENIFDDLALGMGLAPQRMESGVLLLDGPAATGSSSSRVWA